MTEEISAEIGFVGGTGVYGVEGMVNSREVDIDTPFGKPSSKIIIGEVEGTKVAFIARHGVTHRLLPYEIPFRANIYALKSIGVKYLISFGACGSLREEVKPLDLVLVDQYIDRTNGRISSFFGNGIIAHVAFADPICPKFKEVVYESLKDKDVLSEGATIHNSGTYICIDGPAFSTKAESHMYRQWGGTVIGMTAIPEAKLAREAEIAYLTLALVTDYDCWHPDHDSVTVEMVVKTLKKNGDMAQKALIEIVKAVNLSKFQSKAHSALQNSILTHKEHIPEHTKIQLEHIIGRYMK